jgi:hypothetical protein
VQVVVGAPREQLGERGRAQRGEHVLDHRVVDGVLVHAVAGVVVLEAADEGVDERDLGRVVAARRDLARDPVGGEVVILGAAEQRAEQLGEHGGGQLREVALERGVDLRQRAGPRRGVGGAVLVDRIVVVVVLVVVEVLVVVVVVVIIVVVVVALVVLGLGRGGGLGGDHPERDRRRVGIGGRRRVDPGRELGERRLDDRDFGRAEPGDDVGDRWQRAKRGALLVPREHVVGGVELDVEIVDRVDPLGLHVLDVQLLQRGELAQDVERRRPAVVEIQDAQLLEPGERRQVGDLIGVLERQLLELGERGERRDGLEAIPGERQLLQLRQGTQRFEVVRAAVAEVELLEPGQLGQHLGQRLELGLVVPFRQQDALVERALEVEDAERAQVGDRRRQAVDGAADRERLEVHQRTDRCGELGHRLGAELELAQPGHARDDRGQLLHRDVREPQRPQLGQALQRVGQRDEAAADQLEHFELGELRDVVGELALLEVRGPQPQLAEVRDARGERDDVRLGVFGHPLEAAQAGHRRHLVAGAVPHGHALDRQPADQRGHHERVVLAADAELAQPGQAGQRLGEDDAGRDLAELELDEVHQRGDALVEHPAIGVVHVQLRRGRGVRQRLGEVVGHPSTIPATAA